jgi:predicted RNase H-like HicB family nuclease
MSTITRRKSSPKTGIARPFDPRILKRGRAVAARYRVSLWREDGRWYGQTVEEPGAQGDGRTMAQAARAIRESAAVLVAYLIESRKPVVTPIINQDRRGRRKAG